MVTGNKVTDNRLVAVGIQAGWHVTLSKNELTRKGGMPPIVMVFAGAEVHFIDNVIRGTGVAGIRVAGKIQAHGNEFLCQSMRTTGPPQFGVLGLPGSQIALTDNTFDGWRNALNATESTVRVTGNTIRHFHQVALVIRESRGPAFVLGNNAETMRSTDEVLQLTGNRATVRDNRTIASDE